IFDGFDIDWEYPGIVGHLGNHISPNDTRNFTLLLAEFRAELDALGGTHKVLTAAVPAGQDKIRFIETNQIAQYLDYANPMTYDMHGGWEPTGPTNHQTGLYTSPSDPMGPIAPGSAKYSVNSAIQAWLVGDPAYGIPGGFPANKLTMGYPMYYRGWQGVPAGSRNGLYGSATGAAAGAPLSGNTPGVSFYKELNGFVNNPSFTFWDDAAKASYFYNGTTFWSGESIRSIQTKADYQHCLGLAGAMVYSLEDDDPATTLYSAIVNATNGSAGSCPTPPPPGSSPPPPPPPGSSPPPPPPGSSPPPPPPGSSPPAPPGTVQAWQANHAYAAGNQVSYNGRNYECVQPHTSLPGWEPPNVPALWKAL
ncbi:MAG: chitinase, partial [Micromonosporaceae bacterium]|nr:chitinase [Micromonosporaceae bacterium]